MRQRALKGEQKDPFIVTTTNDQDKILLWRAEDEFRKEWSDHPQLCLLSELDNDTKAAGKRVPAPNSPSLPLGDMETRNVVNQRDRIEGFLQRLGMACLGGIFLIGPM